MSQISVNRLTFGYDGSADNVFEDATFAVDTDWRLGFIGRNGKGKTTLLRLMMGEYSYSGSIDKSVGCEYFPYAVTEDMLHQTASEFVEGIKPGCEEWRVICELSLLGEDADVLYREFGKLSPGERTKVLLAVMFSEEDSFMLIDEPTSHLDAAAREKVKEYLAGKKGFILVSHDRDLLDACVDHVLVLNRRTIEVQSGNFSSWEENKQKKDEIINAVDEQLLNVSGIKKNYDCARQAELEEEIARGISNNEIYADYFPAKEGDEVVAKVAHLTAGEDFDVECTDFDSEANEAVLKVTGKGDYSGSYEITVKLNSAVVSKAPTPKKGLTYTGKKQDLIEPGEAEAGGEMQYAIGTKEEPPETFGTEIPMEMNAGKYYVWYMAVGVDESHKNSKPERLEKPVNIAPIEVNIIVDDHMMVKVGDTKTISPKLDGKVRAKFTFESYNEDIAMVDENGVVTGLSDGYATISVGAELASSNYEVGYIPDVTVHVHDGIDISETKVRFYKSSFVYNGKVQRPTIKTIKGWKLKSGTDYTVKYSNKNSKNAGTYKVIVTGKGDYYASTDATYTIKKAPNTMSLKAKTVKVKYKKLKKKSKKIKRADAFTVSKAKGTLSYKLVSAKKGSKSYKSKFKVNSKSGKVTVKKRLKKGTYKVTVKVKAKGTTNYKAGSKTVTFKIRVK